METGPDPVRAERRRWAGRWRAVDLVVAAVLSIAMAVAVLATSTMDGLARAGAAVAALGLGCLAFRRTRPLDATVAVIVVVVVEVVAAPQGTEAPAFLALMIATYSLGAHARPAALVGGLVAAAAGVGVAQVLAPNAGHSHLSAISFFAVVLVLAPVAMGLLVRAGHWMSGRVRARTAEIRAEAPGRIGAERASQRQRVGADIQALILAGLEQMRPHCRAVDLAEVVALRDLGREVLGRLRGLLAELRGAGDESERARVPGQGLAELRAQINRVLAAGAPRDVPPRVPRAAVAPARGSLLRAVGLDVPLIIVAGGYALLLISTSAHAPRPVLSGLAAAVAALPLAVSRHRPLVAAVVSGVAVVVFTASAAPPDPLAGWVISAPLIVVPLAVGAFGTARTALGGLVVCLAATVMAALVPRPAAVAWVDVVSSAVFVVGSWVAGWVTGATFAALAADARTGSLEHDQQAEAVRAALDADRVRVARDLHDAVGHTMTAIVLQAGAAVRVWHSDAALAAGHVAALRDTVADAMDGLRPLVAQVALDGGHTPGLAAIAGLADRARACGLRVDADLDPVPHAADPDRDAIAYRIVQEALTNASRYAPGGQVRLRVRTDPDAITVEVDNDRPPYGPVESAGSGQGLRGMAERVGDCGGTLEAGPTPAGGFRVRAVLPAARQPDGALR